MIHYVEITEILQRVVEIEAEDERSARLMVKQLYRNEDIILDSFDHVDTEIDIFP